jgi:iron complex outermembrane receptor protein
VFSPRLAGIFKVTEGHSLRLSFNRAFRSPSTINNYLDIAIVTPVDLSALGVQDPFPLVVQGVGSELPIGSTSQQKLKEESVTAYEVSYTGSITDRTTLGASFYVNTLDDSIEFVTLPPTVDPYTTANPPPGWPLPPAVIGLLAQAGVYLPRTAFTYLNLGRTRDKGIELSVEHRLSRPLSIFGNYSWQAAPDIVDTSDPFLPAEIGLPPTHRFNIGGTFNGRRYLGALNVNHTSSAFWSDVLTPEYHGFTDGFTLVDGSAGVKWRNERLTTIVKVNNLLNRTIQQHIFGDLIRRSVSLELRVNF